MGPYFSGDCGFMAFLLYGFLDVLGGVGTVCFFSLSRGVRCGIRNFRGVNLGVRAVCTRVGKIVK